MSSEPLHELTIEYLRGSVLPFTLSFEKGKTLTVVYGENGTGKSTICDAFEFLGKGKVGSLENRGLGRTTRYWHSVGKSPNDVVVRLRTSTQECRGEILKSDVLIDPPNSRPHVEVLRRSQILSLIEGTASSRYEVVKPFIDVSDVQTSEDVLRKLVLTLEQQQNQAETRVLENRDTIQQFWEAAGSPGNDPIAWAEGEAVQDTTVAEEEAEAIAGLRTGYSQLEEAQKAWSMAQENAIQAKKSASAAKQEEDSCATAISDDASGIIAILDAARGYLASNPSPESCPLCGSTERTEDLANRVDARRRSFSSLIQARQKTKAAESKANAAELRANTLLETLKGKATFFEEQRTRRQWPAELEMPKESVSLSPEDFVVWLTATNLLQDKWKVAEESRRGRKQFVAALKKAVDTLRENTGLQKDIADLVPRLKRALQCFEEERHALTDSMLNAIAGEVGRLYEEVHAGEGLSKISLMLDPKKRASLNMGADFYGISAEPQAYFSDSHLDTLGLCIFLALSALDMPKEKILVLDDVLASVDEPHVDRLVEMLYSESTRFRHCVITTHYRPWKHKLCWGWLKSGQCQFVELDRWSNHKGLTIIRTLPDVERLRALLAETPPDPQLICAKAGYILEAALNFLTLLYECSVPRKYEDRYTIGDLLPAVKGKLRQALRVGVLKGQDQDGNAEYTLVSLTPILDELSRIAETRNVFGCHFKEISFELLNSDALPFGRQVVALMDVLTDQEAGWPKNPKSGEFWETSGGTRRLYPLRKPA